MGFRAASIVGILALCACSGQQLGFAGCERIGLAPGTPAYAQCVQDAEVRHLVDERMLTKTNNDAPLPMLAQQTTRPMSPLINCTSYAVPLATSPTLCD